MELRTTDIRIRKEMRNSLSGLSVVNIELSSRCNKSCFCCGRRKIEKDYPELAKWGDIDFDLLMTISEQLKNYKNIVIQFHNNGESLLYPRFGEALNLFEQQIRCMDTNGKLLLEKIDEIIGNNNKYNNKYIGLDTLTISVIQDDPEAEEQYNIVKEFLNIKGIKGNRKPYMIYRLLGYIDKNLEERYRRLPGIIARRILHNPMGSFEYKKKVTIPEMGICLDLLSHLVIDRYGNTFPCVRFNPHQYNLLGNVKASKDAKDKTLEEMWNGDIRQNLIREHVKGNRNSSPLCQMCEYYGIPTG